MSHPKNQEESDSNRQIEGRTPADLSRYFRERVMNEALVLDEQDR
ncbi:hypothetical protein [Gloeothece verrucosa]|nr:hypothetical protein [Gloeothece verrucosa]